MIFAQNGLVVCTSLQDVEGEDYVESSLIKQRNTRKGLQVATIIYGSSDGKYPTGIQIWVKNVERNYQEICFEGQKLVLVPIVDIVLSGLRGN